MCTLISSLNPQPPLLLSSPKSALALAETMTSTHKLNKSQILKLFLIASLLIVTPLLSSSLRSTYLYFFANILILVVVAEAGLLSILSSSPPNNKRPSSSSSLKQRHSTIISPYDEAEQRSRRIEKCNSDKVVGEEKMVMIKKSPSMPSIFFIDQPEDRGVHEDIVGGDEGEEIGEVSGQELFQKAETFIGNFYKQLKMQREDSWKKLHDFCHKAF